MGVSSYTYRASIERNAFGAGHFPTVTLYRDGAAIRQWSTDSTLWNWCGERWLRRKCAWLRDIYGAVPR